MTIDANDLERMAEARPDEYFLKGSGVLKLIGAIRTLEAQVAALKAQPAPTEAQTYPCWSCKKPYTLDQRSYADGRCPHCDVDIDLDDDPTEAQGEHHKLLTIIAAAYQIAGAHDAQAAILDVLADPEGVTMAQVEAMPKYRVQGEDSARLDDLATIRDLDKIAMEFAASLVQLPVSEGSRKRNIDYVVRQDVVDLVMTWRGAWEENSKARKPIDRARASAETGGVKS